jgi:prolyl oligopeptidase PreP (S9A serine peptidase family)
MLRFNYWALLIVLTLGFPFCAFAQGPTCATVLTRSEQYRWLEKNSAERQAWVRQENAKTNNNLKASANLKAIGDYAWRSFDKAQVLKTVKLESGKKLELFSGGLGKPTELRITGKNKSKVLFSNFDFAKNNSISLLNYSVSPSQNLVVGIFTEKGSLNHYWAQVYSIPLGRFVSEKLTMENDEIAWLSKESFIFQSQLLKESRVHSWSAEQGELVHQGLDYIRDGGNKISVVESGSEVVLADSDGQSLHLNSKFSYSRFIGQDSTDFIFLNENRGISVLEVLGKYTNRSSAIATIRNRVVDSAALDESGKFIILDHHFGADHKIQILSTFGNSLGEFPLPMGVTGEFIGWKKEGRIALLELSSDVRDKVMVKWDLSKNIEIKQVEKDLLLDGVDQFETKVVEVASADGTMIPVRLTYKAGVRLDGKNPALIKVYGGFGEPGMFYGEDFSPMNKLFLQKGGILVAPAIRGGNEFGEPWHQAGGGSVNKHKGLEDTIAVADWLKENNYSEPAKIISMGTSNGGFVVAASALKSSNSFGLVIPVAGLHDMLGKRRMGKIFDEVAWAAEYGDSQSAKEYRDLKSFSPIEMSAGKAKTEFFLLTGQDDSRVTPSHTYKLAEALKAQNVKVQMTSLKNAGHWMESPEYQNVIGWRAQSVIWAKIYDFLGISI